MSTLYFAAYISWQVAALPCTLALFHVAFILAMVAYHQAVVTDPGRIPDSWIVPASQEDKVNVWMMVAAMVKERKRTTGELRFCSKERKYKPDRAHFCAQMGRNVLRMDHYCPWLSNCVGHRNHKHFLLFLLYTVLATHLALWGLFSALFLVGLRQCSAGELVLILHCTCLGLVLACTLTPFLAFHCWLLARNMTTVEFCERRGEEVKYIWDTGLVGNVQTVMGASPWLWLLPCGGPAGDGIVWNRVEKSAASSTSDED
eukprot:218275-Amphidinium_carterae.1